MNGGKSTDVTFTPRRADYPTLILHDRTIPKKDGVKFLGVYLDRSLTWTQHIKVKRTQIALFSKKYAWLAGCKSRLNALQHKMVIKPVRTEGLQLWDAASRTNRNLIDGLG